MRGKFLKSPQKNENPTDRGEWGRVQWGSVGVTSRWGGRGVVVSGSKGGGGGKRFVGKEEEERGRQRW